MADGANAERESRPRSAPSHPRLSPRQPPDCPVTSAPRSEPLPKRLAALVREGHALLPAHTVKRGTARALIHSSSVNKGKHSSAHPVPKGRPLLTAPLELPTL